MKTDLIIDPKTESAKIIDFLKKTFRAQKINQIVIGLSGGIDSATSLYLLKEALPVNNIQAVYLPYKKPYTFSHMEILEHINFPKTNFQIIPVTPVVDQINQLTRNSPTRNPLTSNQLTIGNIMARVRMIFLFDLAKKHQALVCGTENKSEHYLGYYTRFGDAASDIEPISHLYKTQVYQLAKYLNVPKKVIDQLPSANLWPGQTDEGQFGFTYHEADQVLSLHFDKKLTLDQIEKQGFKNSRKILQWVKKNEFKMKVPYHL